MKVERGITIACSNGGHIRVRGSITFQEDEHETHEKSGAHERTDIALSCRQVIKARAMELFLHGTALYSVIQMINEEDRRSCGKERVHVSDEEM